MWTVSYTDGVEQSNLVKDLLDDTPDHSLVEMMFLCAQEFHHISCLCLMLNQYNSVYGLQYFN